ncbi:MULTISPECIES: hypothetical protein [Deinococcus]|uniref:hypothetical protein n=1 Tax=Deinococcus TaxID=1298 RepID=UPI001C836E06|nr:MULTISPECIES: hypothetical protein [Deinococcus]MBZ9713946.1 hypothetical protein [Deinococcus multiflagellatus]
MPALARQLLIALAAALLWVGIGLWQRTRGGAELGSALLAELPLGAAVFVLALVWVRLRRQ